MIYIGDKMNDEIKERLINKFVFSKQQQASFGNNEFAVAVMIRFFNDVYCDDSKKLIDNFDKLLDYNENLKIFKSEKIGSNYMANFKALTVNRKDDNYVISHELGHAILNLVDNTTLPPNFQDILIGAKDRALKIDNLSVKINDEQLNNCRFRTILEYICNKDNVMEDVGPFSDIISSMWQTPGFPTADGKKLILPYFHTQKYYTDELSDGTNVINYQRVYDEQFANFFTLYTNNRKETLFVLKELFDNDWYSLMEDKLIELENNIALQKDNDLKNTSL